MAKVDFAAALRRIPAYVLFVAVAGAPFPLGSRDALTVTVWCIVLAAGLLFASTGKLRRGHFAVLGGIAIIVAAYGFVLHEQLAASPWFAPPHPIWAEAAKALGEPIAPAATVVRGEPFYAIGAPLVAILALTLGLLVGAERAQARRALAVFAWAGVCYAAYAIFAFLFEPGSILWMEKTAYIGSLTGTFVNRNTAATFFGSCAAVWLVLLLESVRGRLPRGEIVWSSTPKYLLNDVPRELTLRFAMFFLCLAALLLTNSRGGVLFSLLVFVVTFVVYFRRDLPRGKSLVVATLAAGVLALAVLQFLGSNVGRRIDAGGLSDAGRLAAYESSLRMIADNPWFGTGLGTFTAAFPPYRSAEISLAGIWDAAHSTPLELAVEVGIPLAVLVALGWLAMLSVLVWGVRGPRRTSLVPLSALSVGLIALLHSSIDFSLQVSGYAIVVFALLGIALGYVFADEASDTPAPRRRRRRPASEREDAEMEQANGAAGDAATGSIAAR